GAGKSTLAKLVARFYDPTAGTVAVDGQDLRDVTGVSLRGAVALVPQEGFLFDGTIAENIALACEGCTREDVERACEALGIARRMRALPDGLDTEVSTGGHTLSSGQRQLVALARALVLSPHVLILDEATSNLDPATDALVEEAMETLLAGRTALIIAHRVETAMRTDRVVMLRDGEIVEDGTPDELLARGGVFADWVLSVRATSGA
ncbi:MAG TPA: ATP-binding cassette domain-containing protein, partial [Nitriliruptorales bacterium]